MSRFRLFVVLTAVLALLGAAAPAAAGQAIDPAFSDAKLRALGLPEVIVEATPDGFEAPESLPAGLHLFTLSGGADHVAYLDIMQPPAGLSDQEALDLALGAGRDDLAQPDWVYVGGTNTPNPGQTASFVVDLAPGEYRLATSYYLPPELGGDGEETMELLPLTVTEADAAAEAAAPPADVTLEETDDMRYLVSPGTVPSGPRIWKIENTGRHHAHHLVMMRVPDGTTSQAIIDEFSALWGAMAQGTPPAAPAEESIMARMTWVGYAALQSGGQTTWAEFDLEPATYAVVCYIIDPETGNPHFLNGMVTVFEVA